MDDSDVRSSHMSHAYYMHLLDNDARSCDTLICRGASLLLNDVLKDKDLFTSACSRLLAWPACNAYFIQRGLACPG